MIEWKDLSEDSPKEGEEVIITGPEGGEWQCIKWGEAPLLEAYIGGKCKWISIADIVSTASQGYHLDPKEDPPEKLR